MCINLRITNRPKEKLPRDYQRGVSLIELIVFMVVISIAFAALMSVYVQSTINNADPLINSRLLEAAQSRLDEVIALKYAEETPTGGVPACNPCSAIVDGLNDVDDFNGKRDNPYPNYERVVAVTVDGDRKLITVTVSAPSGQTAVLSAYRYNF